MLNLQTKNASDFSKVQAASILERVVVREVLKKKG
jgi:hypothetical protein